ncbi:hypothetical protein SODALDRAFT_332182 [Sodiomyces alkalinus F11]|uniref:Fibronectin type-III domain-containing protein n=1 Tax=Sodiomyces alkalinus (strain CBS 110278 / VKM F-3762 / F11) TaxID=1314773 RepID=A0A3N2Q015_SODAK|nr:hypothetical protein SODALDRAFT_332182 [Sodiomyces alkalinus F11]ROT40028.1 hypothetical protein SODALDRAFT_332182 [Sodiomyces alkalinus F11]
MLWLLLTRFLLISCLVAWWVTRPASSLLILLRCILTIVTFWVISPLYANIIFVRSLHYSRELFWYLRLDTFLLGHANMIVTLAAVFWLLNRTWQTLWKPTPELISILGVDVPEPPDVSLAGIRVDAATLNWTRPPSNRPVQKYLIQVNGVNVGESRPEETAITVTGLRPNHCYNVRVIAVGPNNFQTGSQIIRLRTYKRDGRPDLGNSRIPDSFHDQEPKNAQSLSTGAAGNKAQVPSIEAAPSLEGGPAAPREGSSSAPGQRRNTLNRRHSPSVASQDQPAIKLPYDSDRREPSLKELADALEKTRNEIEDILAQYGQEETDFRILEDTLKKEKEKKKQLHKEKDDHTAQLKQRVKATYEQMRQTNKDKARKENLLKEKQDKRRKVQDSVEKCNEDVSKMKKSREGFATEEDSIQQDRDLKLKHLEEEIAALKEEHAQLESEYKEKKEQLKDLETERKKLPGGDEDERWKEDDRKARREFDFRKRDLQSQLIMESRRAQQIENHMHVLQTQIYAQQQASAQVYSQANASGVDFDQPVSAQVKRRSRASNTSLPNPVVAAGPPTQFVSPPDTMYGPTTVAGLGGRSSFAPGPFMDMSSADLGGAERHGSDVELRVPTGGAPLSPTATALLPSGILGDDDPPSPPSESRRSPVGWDHENDPKSPTSSGRMSRLSSPHASTHHLPFDMHRVDSSERRSLNDVTGSPGAGGHAPASGHHRFTNLLATFNRSRGVRDLDDGGPVLGTLKAGQSQSFPRQGEEGDTVNKRRIAFATNWFLNRNIPDSNPTSAPGPGSGLPSAPGPTLGESEGNMPPPSRFSARRLNPFASSSGVFPDRVPTSPRPASIASAEFPRPSTDSGSIWGAPGDGGGMANFSSRRIWLPETAPWSSRNPSRRPSLHGSPSALKTTLASADDEILDEEALLDPHVSPSQVGVIGRPLPASRLLEQRLNPAAPTFMAGFFRPKDKESDAGKDKGKGKEKEKGRDKAKDRDKKAGSLTPSMEAFPGMDESPTESRISRDTFSVHTQTSVSESRESLTLSLEPTFSNTPSDNPSTGASASLKEQESAMRKLFRKGSASKFSISSRLGKDSGLFKKGPGSATHSDKNYPYSAERSSIGDVDDLCEADLNQLGRSYDSVTSSPSFGPIKSRDASQGGGRMSMSGWSSRFSMKKKGRENKESLEMDRPSETEGE